MNVRADLNCFNDRIWGEFGLCDDSCLEGVSMLADDATREEGAKIYLKKWREIEREASIVRRRRFGRRVREES
jgi:hypothetical protein